MKRILLCLLLLAVVAIALAGGVLILLAVAGFAAMAALGELLGTDGPDGTGRGRGSELLQRQHIPATPYDDRAWAREWVRRVSGDDE